MPGQLLATRVGLSGLVLLVVFAVMWAFSGARVRRHGRFERFYLTHLLYLGWFALALVHASDFWMWAAVPLLGFAVDRALRHSRRARSTEIFAGHALRSGVTRLEIRRPPGFRHRAGDYLFLRVPEIARHEWHSFTISSAPATHIFESRHAVLIGAGIGVTPFAGIEQIDHRGLVEMHIFMTGGRGDAAAAVMNLARSVAGSARHLDVVTGLRAHTRIGRPDWTRELGTIARRYGPGSVDVYFCGPPGLGRTVHRACTQLELAPHGFRRSEGALRGD